MSLTVNVAIPANPGVDPASQEVLAEVVTAAQRNGLLVNDPVYVGVKMAGDLLCHRWRVEVEG